MHPLDIEPELYGMGRHTTANIYQFSCGSVAYFAPDAPDFQEAGELKGDAIAIALRVLDARGALIQSKVEQLK